MITVRRESRLTSWKRGKNEINIQPKGRQEGGIGGKIRCTNRNTEKMVVLKVNNIALTANGLLNAHFKYILVEKTLFTEDNLTQYRRVQS